ncbi:tellurite-resistance/dicarboxylate transporter [Methanothermococcus sp.]|uniref:tellurite-resistance/dicarboxylate transporter n=1 Tax=Methanothermococcus sp. TaxID=2614238 RepID=UPI0025FDB80A|nr:tellurite-resistance/dicarboxylate transporter [Methanothermococcus sp.]
MLEACGSKCNIIKNFIPSWFAAIMGTGILAISSSAYSLYIPMLSSIAVILFYLNIIMFFAFIIPWTLRWVMYPKNAFADLKHPILSSFYPTVAVGMLVLASDFIVIGHNIDIAKYFWAFGAIGMLLFSVIVPYYMFKSEDIRLDHVNPGWYIPPVGLIVVPIAGSLIMSHLTGIWHELALFINYYGWGTGFFLYLAILAVVMYRFILHNPLPSTLAPTIWINLGPIGAGIIALVNLIKYTPFVSIKEPFYVFSLLFWGFGLWWALMAILMTIHYCKNLKLPYGMPWWAFIFPLGAYVTSSHVIYGIFPYHIIDYIGFGLYWLLFGLWAITFIKTAISTYHGYPFKDN